MTNNDKWGKEWPIEAPRQRSEWDKDVASLDWPTDLKSGIEINHVKKVDDEFNKKQLQSQGSNLVDAQSYLYFQCEGCGEILDPHTKSFKALEDFRFNAGWKVKWNMSGMGYKVYCQKCGEKV